MIRAHKVERDTLDNQLIRLQEQGHDVTQIFPVPVSVQAAVNGEEAQAEITMHYMIIYREKEVIE